jgi:exopolysaccharide biosynthesis polyprenyl glycosylphosphotransferase
VRGSRINVEPSATDVGQHPRRRALDFRARLSDRQSVAARRHALRLASRVAILLASDLTAFLLARTALRMAAGHPSIAERFSASLISAGPLANPGEPGSTVFPVALALSLALTGSYTRHRGLNPTARIGVATVIAVAAAAVPLAALLGVSRAVSATLIVGAASWMFILLTRSLTEAFLARVWPRARWAGPAVVIGPEHALAAAPILAVSRPGGDFSVAAHHCVLGPETLGDPRSFAAKIHVLIDRADAEAVILCESLPDRYVTALLETVLETGCQLLYPVRAVRVEHPRPRLVWHHDHPFFELGAPVLKTSAVAVKRALDILLGSVLLIVAFPMMLILAAGIRLDSGGPVLFRQHRAGRGGRRFNMLKFRTMRPGADEEKLQLSHLNESGDVRIFKISSDPRVTRFGGFLRRWSLDELPQLWNVLRGDMSLVGPRPFFEADFAAYEDHHFRRLDTKPGITGLWQVSGRSDVVDFEEVVFLDRQYIEQWSIWLDVSILFRTISAVARRRGAY